MSDENREEIGATTIGLFDRLAADDKNAFNDLLIDYRDRLGRLTKKLFDNEKRLRDLYQTADIEQGAAMRLVRALKKKSRRPRCTSCGSRPRPCAANSATWLARSSGRTGTVGTSTPTGPERTCARRTGGRAGGFRGGAVDAGRGSRVPSNGPVAARTGTRSVRVDSLRRAHAPRSRGPARRIGLHSEAAVARRAGPPSRPARGTGPTTDPPPPRG